METSCAISKKPAGKSQKPRTGKNQKHPAAMQRMPSGRRTIRACGFLNHRIARVTNSGDSLSSSSKASSSTSRLPFASVLERAIATHARCKIGAAALFGVQGSNMRHSGM